MNEWQAIYFEAGLILHGVSALPLPDALSFPLGALAVYLDTGRYFINQLDNGVPTWREIETKAIAP